MTHRELCELGAKWLTNAISWKIKSPVAAIELVSACKENPDVFGFRGHKSVLLEIKVSRRDFKRDKLKPHKQFGGVGMTRYYMCPENLIKAEEITNDWGLVYCNIETKKFTIIKESECFEQRDFNSELDLMQSVIRRLAGKNKILDFRKNR